MHEDSSMMYWWPRISSSPPEGVKLPRTTGIEAIQSRLWSEKDYLMEVAELILKVRDPRKPLFMRTDQSSDKHSWNRSCYIPSDKEKGGHPLGRDNILDRLMGFIEMHDPPFGPPPFGMIYLRDIIPLKRAFVAFHGKMPVCREFRVFATPSKLTHFQPYWPAEAIEATPWKPEGWEAALVENNQITPEERYRLSVIACAAADIVSSEETEWSVDLCQDIEGDWWLTDMALGEESYRYDPETGARLTSN